MRLTVSGDNRIQDVGISSFCLLRTLESLNISNNCLTSIDTTYMPNLRTLNVDKNSISYIAGLKQIKKLVTLSWREQSLDLNSAFAEIQYQDCRNIQNLFLSSNVLSSFDPITPFLNLRNLELASTGLKTLTPSFGKKLQNLRVLNLNYNALRDLRPLVGIERLQQVFLAGNRISRLRQTTMVLERLGAELEVIDLRQNSLTAGFYTPQELRSKPERQIALQNPKHPSEESSDEDADIRSAEAYLLPAIDKKLDSQSRARLDEDTKLHRRVYEMLIVSSCRDLNVLDGMPAPTKSPGRKDVVWDRLLELGVLKKGGEGDLTVQGLEIEKVRKKGS